MSSLSKVLCAMHSFITAVSVQFGPHFAKNISPLKDLFSADTAWNINASRWGIFQAAVTLASAIFPWLIGHRVDSKTPAKTVLVIALILCCMGQVVFILACIDASLALAYLGRFVFGIGEGLASALSGYIAFRYLPAHNMFAMGLIQSFHALAVATSKAFLIPIANTFGGYVASLLFAFLLCILSLLSSLLWKPSPQHQIATISPRTWKHYARRSRGRLSPDFWIVACMHLLFSSAHRLFGHIDAPFLRMRFGESLSAAGYMSSVTEFTAVVVSPVLGALLDKYCTVRTLPILLLLAAGTGATGYAVLAWADEGEWFVPATGLLLIGIVNGMTPTVMKCVVPDTVDESVLATAFGVYESSESIGVMTGAILIGLVAERAKDNYSDCVPVFCLILVTAGFLSIILITRRTTGVGSPRSFHSGSDIEVEHPLLIYG